MKKCEHYFPTMEFTKDSAGDKYKAAGRWRRVVLEAKKGGVYWLIGEESVDVGDDGGDRSLMARMGSGEWCEWTG